MRTTAILLIVGFIQVSAHGFGQEKITLTEKDATLKKTFEDIQKQTSYNIWYKDSLLLKTFPVTIEVKEATLEETLNRCLRGQPVGYSILGKDVVIERKKVNDTPSGIDLKGKVVNEKGEPLPGAAILIKGTNKGTQTDAGGVFELKNVDPNAELIISFTGYQAQTIRVKGNISFVITLSVSTNPLDEVQVIAYGTVSKRLNTGDVSTVTSKEIEEQSFTNPLAALEGRVPGLDVTQNTGVPGGSFTVQIRGQNSINSGNNPFYIIDGVPFTSTSIASFFAGAITAGGSPLSSFNPSDIESVEILKDADATAIYGSRGANGVILITTKKGKPGKTVLDISTYRGSGEVPKMMNLLNTQQYLQMRNEAFTNDGATPNPYSDYDLTAWDTTRYTNWQKTLIGGTAHNSDIQGSISGGSINTQFLVGGGYHKESSVFPGDFSDQKTSIHFSITHSTTDQKFKMTVSGGYYVENNKLPQEDLTNQAITLPPDAPPIYDSIGKINWANNTFNNPFANYLLQLFLTTTTHLIGNANLSYELLPGLYLKTSLGYTQLEMSENETAPINSWLPSYGITTGASYFCNSSTTSWVIEPQAEYNKDIFSGKLKVLIGSTFQENKTQGQVIYASGYVSDALLENIAASAQQSLLTSSYALYRYDAIFARINYDWNNKYLFNFSARRDGSSRFGPGKQFGDFGAAGAAWIFSEESLIKNNLHFLSFGKIRGNYGTTGNDQITDYQYLSTYSPTSYPYQGNLGLLPTRLYNPDFAWEVNKKLEGGAEFSFLKDKLFFSFSYYQNRSSDLLLGYPLPNFVGFSSIQSNFPALVQNKGWEFQFSSINFKNKNFEWSTKLNFTIPKNTLLSFPNIANTGYSYYYAVGKPLYVEQSFPYLGVNSQTGVYEFTSKSGPTFNPSYPSDLQPVATVAKKFYGGLNNAIRYKGFELTIFIQFVKQTGWSYLYAYYQGAPGMMVNQPTLVMNRWQKPGDITNVEKFTQDYGSDAYTAYSNAIFTGSNRITNASFIRLKNIYLSYQLPERLKQKMHLRNGSIYIQGQNLFTIDHYIGLDPETQSLSYLPPLRMITTGIRFTF